jgi:DNA-binding CsgD family transcriptional regulator
MVNAYKIAHSLFLEGTGSKLLSAIIRLQRLDGQYSNIYLQQYLFYSIRPYESVFMFQIHTDLNWYKATRTRHYFCIDNDVSNFRYPDQEMLAHGRNLSDREFQIINLVSSGLNSEQIAKKLCLSKHTINTHRRNILQKTRTINLHRPVIDLYKQDFF